MHHPMFWGLVGAHGEGAGGGGGGVDRRGGQGSYLWRDLTPLPVTFEHLVRSNHSRDSSFTILREASVMLWQCARLSRRREVR